MSDFLFAHASWLTGAARLLDLGGVFDDYNSCDGDPVRADELALRADWRATGVCLRDAMNDVHEDIEAEAAEEGPPAE